MTKNESHDQSMDVVSLHVPKAIKNVAADWLSRRDAGLTAEQLVEFETWLKTDPRHAAVYNGLASSWQKLDRPLNAGVAAELERELNRFAAKRRRRRYAVSTSVAAMLFIAGFVWQTQHLRSPSSAQPTGNVAVLMPTQQRLADGSLVELKEDSLIETHFDAQARRVVLKRGEALFHVTKDAKHPFIVVASGVEVRAVGTAFSVQLGQKDVGIIVTEGRVAIEKPTLDDPRKMATVLPPEVPVLAAGQRALVGLEQSAIAQVRTVLPEEISEELAWRAPRLEFTATPLAEVIATVNRYNHVQYVIDDATLGKEPVSGLVRADNFDAFIRMLEGGDLGAKVERRADLVIIRRAP